MKRIISILLCICMICSLPVLVYADSDENNERFLLAQELIEKLSEDYVLPADQDTLITRAEFVFTLTQVLGIKGSVCSFEDVPKKHFAYKAIAAAEGMGMTQQNSMFYPDKPITYQNAVEMVVTALGYKGKAEYYGGYPSGYLRIATELRLLKKLDGKQMTVKNAIMLIFNTINSYPLEMESMKNNVASYVPSDNTLLYKYRQITYAEGIVTADEASGLTKVKNAVGKERIVIGNDMYYYEAGDELLGRNCVVFYEDTEDNTVICVRPYLNDEQKISVRKYYGVEDDKLQYEKSDGKKGYFRLNPAYTILYNRKAVSGMDADYLVNSADAGFIELIDNNDDGKYDIISITAYKYAWVSDIDLVNKIIYDRVSGQNIDVSDDYLALNVKTLDGETFTATDLSEISSDSLIAYAESEDKKAYSIVICRNSINAKISEVRGSDNTLKAIANDEEYDMSNFIFTFTQTPLGMAGTFYLGVNGEIVALSGTDKILKYGYVYRAGYSEAKERHYVRLLTEDGDMELMYFTDRVMIDGTTRKLSDAWDSLVSYITSDKKCRIVRYGLKDGEVSVIDTAQSIGSITRFDEAVDSNNSLTVYYEGETMYSEGGATFSPAFNLGAGTVNFVVPPDGDAHAEDVSKYRVEQPDYFVNGNNYDIVAYDIEGNSSAGATLSIDSGSASGVGVDTPSAVVSEMRKTVDEDREQVYALTLWENGKFAEYFTKYDCEGDIDKLQEGDIIRYKLRDGKIEYLVIDYDFSQNSILPDLTKKRGRLEYFGGQVFSFKSGYSYIYTGSDTLSLPVEFTNLRNTKISGVPTALVEVNSAGRITVKNMSVNAIRDYLSTGTGADRIVIRQKYYVSQLNVVYRMEE
ncbi:MAG: S-layer homology domain-containing protein [Clostridia bacterium]|nr:S-layer homology domain-containing protein [Clostridia bacterium]